MRKIEQISMVQMIAIFTISRLMVDYSYMPSVCSMPANQDAWIADLLAGPFIFIFCLPALFLMNKFKGMNLMQFTEKITGKFVSKIIGAYLIIYFLFLCTAVILFMVDFLKSSIFPHTPLYVLCLFIIVPCMYASYKGIEAIGRSCVILGVFVFGSIIVFTIFNINNMDFNNLLPVFTDSGVKRIAAGTFNVGGRFCDSGVLYMFAPFLARKASMTKTLSITIIIFTILYLLISITTETILGPELARSLNYPYYIAIQQTNLFDFIQRIEFFTVIIWCIIFYVKICTTFYANALVVANVFKAKSYKPFILPLNIIVFVALLIAPLRNNPMLRIAGESEPYVASLFITMFVIPFILLIVYFFRRKTIQRELPLTPLTDSLES